MCLTPDLLCPKTIIFWKVWFKSKVENSSEIHKFHNRGTSNLHFHILQDYQPNLKVQYTLEIVIVYFYGH